MARTIKLTLNGRGGELDCKMIEVADDYETDGDPGTISTALLAWLEEEGILLCAGDTIVVSELMDAEP